MVVELLPVFPRRRCVQGGVTGALTSGVGPQERKAGLELGGYGPGLCEFGAQAVNGGLVDRHDGLSG